jgi:hypothetical protein
MKFKIDGRELETYQLSNKELVKLFNSTTDEKEKQELSDDIIYRFNQYLCAEDGETEDDVFAKFFSGFVNGKMRSPKKIAKRLGKEHRYLQQEMFKVCIEYIKELARHKECGFYDPRNEWACDCSQKIVEFCKSSNVYI